ncbi:MAG: universal stress protein, partial [Myxococcales bacterium]|nr:universal stress protein [Myxococcales bacterium]
MFELKHILIPVDHSEGSRSALAAGLHLANRYEAIPHWFHAVPTIPQAIRDVLFPYAAMGEDIVEFENELTAYGNRVSERFADDVSSGNKKVPGRAVNGDPEDGIINEINRLGPDLLIMGASGQRGPRANQLGRT